MQVSFTGGGASGLKRPGPAQPPSEQPRGVIGAALGSLPGTAHYVLEEDGQYVRASGLVQPIAVIAFLGDARWLGYAMSSGHWYTGPGQAVMPKRLLRTLHASVGETVTITGLAGRAIAVRIVGEVFDQEHDGLTMLTDWRTLAAADPGLTPDPMNTQYDVGLRPGTDPTAYVRALGPKLGPNYGASINQNGGAATAIALAGTLTLLPSLAAGLGVLNTVVLHTRERAHDLGVFKAIGMTPRQTVAMVLCSVAGTGLLAGVLAVPPGSPCTDMWFRRWRAPPASASPPASRTFTAPGSSRRSLWPDWRSFSPARCCQPAGRRRRERLRRCEPSRDGGGVEARLEPTRAASALGTQPSGCRFRGIESRDRWQRRRRPSARRPGARMPLAGLGYRDRL